MLNVNCEVGLPKNKVVIVPREGIAKNSVGLLGILALAISLFGISSCAASDGDLQETFMSYCQFGGRIEVDSVVEAIALRRARAGVAVGTGWFPGTRSTCRSALRCIEERLPQDQFEYENTFYDLVGEFSDPMAEVIVGCVEGGYYLGG
tara:strand:- start:21 stop:467 length:447 start_codon:yes stop_codon:yes gene_type:complete